LKQLEDLNWSEAKEKKIKIMRFSLLRLVVEVAHPDVFKKNCMGNKFLIYILCWEINSLESNL